MRIAIYAGTFDPITAGHLSVIEAAAGLFDRLVVLIAVNPDKRPLFTVEERIELGQASLSSVHVNVTFDSTELLVVEYARQVGATVLVRGIRGATDAEYETEMANFNRSLAPEIETVFLPAHAELARISSSGLKELARCGEDGSTYCSAEVWARLLSRIERNKEICLEDSFGI